MVLRSSWPGWNPISVVERFSGRRASRASRDPGARQAADEAALWRRTLLGRGSRSRTRRDRPELPASLPHPFDGSRRPAEPAATYRVGTVRLAGARRPPTRVLDSPSAVVTATLLASNSTDRGGSP